MTMLVLIIQNWTMLVKPQREKFNPRTNPERSTYHGITDPCLRPRVRP